MKAHLLLLFLAVNKPLVLALGVGLKASVPRPTATAGHERLGRWEVRLSKTGTGWRPGSAGPTERCSVCCLPLVRALFVFARMSCTSGEAFVLCYFEGIVMASLAKTPPTNKPGRFAASGQ